jgi:RHS repeat-associated protein
VVVLTDENGTKEKTYSYTSFGIEYNPNTFDTNPFRYCGEYYDIVSGTIYLRVRYYNADLGRFTQEDTHWNISNMVYGDNPENKTPNSSAIMQSGNLYVYCGNNPIMYRDLTGNSFLLTALVFIGVSTVIGGCVGAFSAACNKGTTEEIKIGGIHDE